MRTLIEIWEEIWGETIPDEEEHKRAFRLLEDILKKINKYEDLKVFAPYINHDKNLISRLPLYKKWFGYDKNYKQIFFNQCLEYIAMGYIIKNYYKKNCLILASDHKAMRPYYNLLANINLIASSASY